MNKSTIVKFLFFSLLGMSFAAGCTGKDSNTTSKYQPTFSADTSEKNTLIFGVPSFAYSETAEDLVKYLNAHLSGFHIKMKACLTYEEYLKLFKQKKFDLTFISGIQAFLQSDSGYTICGKISNDKEYTSVIFSQKSAGIKNVLDLKGKKAALIAGDLVPGSMMPMYYLLKNKLDVNHDIVWVYVPSFESTIIATYLGKSDAGMCLKRNWEVYIKSHPEILSKLVLNWETPHLINNPLLIKNGTDSAWVSKLQSLFFSMHTSSEGKMALNKLGIDGFEKANRDTYKPLMEFKRRYDLLIH